MKHRLLEKIDVEQRRKDEWPELRIGDEIAVHVKLREGDKERVQVFRGTLIARDGGGATETITVRRISFGYGVERVFPLHSPAIVRIDVEGHGRARRAKLYYLRKRVGKAARLENRE